LLLGAHDVNQGQRQEYGHRIVAAGLDLERGTDPLLEAHARRMQQRENGRGVGRADDGADQHALHQPQP